MTVTDALNAPFVALSSAMPPATIETSCPARPTNQRKVDVMIAFGSLKLVFCRELVKSADGSCNQMTHVASHSHKRYPLVCVESVQEGILGGLRVGHECGEVCQLLSTRDPGPAVAGEAI